MQNSARKIPPQIAMRPAPRAEFVREGDGRIWQQGNSAFLQLEEQWKDSIAKQNSAVRYILHQGSVETETGEWDGMGGKV